MQSFHAWQGIFAGRIDYAREVVHMWFKAKARAGGRVNTGLAIGAISLGLGAAVLLFRRLVRR